MVSEKRKREYELLELIRNKQPMAWSQRLELVVRLSIPSILAQLSVILMMYIDASMVGTLGAEASASIGLVSTTMWLFNGVCIAAATGFSVQAAHRIGANDLEGARAVLRQAFVITSLFGLIVAVIGCAISSSLPEWLGGNADIVENASRYFLIYAMSLPFLQLNYLSGGMLRCSGNMRVPSLLSMLMCVLDVFFNLLLIFPSREVCFAGFDFVFPGAGMGVAGAALGTALAVVVTSSLMTGYLCFHSPELALHNKAGSFRPTFHCLKNAAHISVPMGCERIIMCGAQIMSTVIVAPLGTIAIAANAFAITAESLCYMPGYGVADASTTLIGQCRGAGSRELAWRFSRMTVFLGIIVMTFMGIVMYLAAPFMMSIMTPVEEVRELGTTVLRIEAFAEPMFAASIVAYGVFVGMGDTIVPSCMNFFSIWGVRLSLAALLAPKLGLQGVWIAMCIELCFRGVIFLIRLFRKKWLNAIVSA